MFNSDTVGASMQYSAQELDTNPLVAIDVIYITAMSWMKCIE